MIFVNLLGNLFNIFVVKVLNHSTMLMTWQTWMKSFSSFQAWFCSQSTMNPPTNPYPQQPQGWPTNNVRFHKFLNFDLHENFWHFLRRLILKWQTWTYPDLPNQGCLQCLKAINSHSTVHSTIIKFHLAILSAVSPVLWGESDVILIYSFSWAVVSVIGMWSFIVLNT